MLRFKLMISLMLIGLCMVNFLWAQNSPLLSNVHITDAGGGQIDANGLQRNLPIRLNLSLLNMNLKEEVAAGNFELRIEIGDKATLLPATDIKKLPYANYLAWSYEKGVKGTNRLTAKIIKSLPPDFVARMEINLQCVASGKAEISCGIYSNEKLAGNTLNQAFFTVMAE